MVRPTNFPLIDYFEWLISAAPNTINSKVVILKLKAWPQTAFPNQRYPQRGPQTQISGCMCYFNQSQAINPLD